MNRLEWSGLLLIVALLIGARLFAAVAGWLITRTAERAASRWRLPILRFKPIVRLLIAALGAVLIIVPILVQPTFENVIALLATLGLALAFALKDYGSSLVAGLVTVLEGTYQDADGEVRSIGPAPHAVRGRFLSASGARRGMQMTSRYTGRRIGNC